MARIIHFLCVVFFTFANTSHSVHEKPQAFLQPIHKDKATNLYYSPLSIGVNMLNGTYYQSYNINLAIDLGGSTPLLLTCAAAAKSVLTTQSNVAPLDANKPNRILSPVPPIPQRKPHVKNRFPLLSLSIPSRLMTIACTDVNVDPLFKSFPSIVVGTLGLAKTFMALPLQAVSFYKLPSKVALCLPSPNSGDPFGSGALFIGGGPYFMALYPEDVSKIFVSTPLLPSDPSRGEYFIGVKSIQISEKTIPFVKKSTKICTLAPYTILHSSIYKALVLAFAGKAKMAKAPAVKPFGSCFSSKGLGKWMMGSRVPVIDLVLNGGAKWRIYGSNSLVKVSKNVVCLGFVDGGMDMKMAMVIGGFQMEDNLVEFDLEASKFSFSTSLLLINSSCSQSRYF
ncbi:unnamed protein product [Thlaspi arvense]|uniref:Xylanase inhibitor C-terminal domain-containing protein n=1 Tax=Thlaspi arvense TaxID=13288 RepID=A0AAU9RPI5_THLAR|nr:unnamed protein product [Thlaspi arvense]